MFSTLVAIGIIVLQIFIVAFVVLWIRKSSFLNKIYNYSHLILPIVFIGSALGSLIFELSFGFEPCLLCWYQRIFIFSIAILSLTGDIRKNKLLQKQVIVFSIIGILFALFHNYIDIFPSSGLDICGAGPSCLKRYIFEFGYITIPMMSLTVLILGLMISVYAKNKTREFISLR